MLQLNEDVPSHFPIAPLLPASITLSQPLFPLFFLLVGCVEFFLLLFPSVYSTLLDQGLVPFQGGQLLSSAWFTFC